MASYTRGSIVVDGLSLSYLEKKGSSDIPLLFLHGWGGSAESFIPLWDELSQSSEWASRRLLAIDFPGFGESPEPPTAWDVARYALCVVQFLDALGIEKADVVNHSFGGRVTTVLLTQYPHRFNKAFFIAPAGIRHTEKVQRIENTAGVLKRIFQLPGLRILFPFVRKIGYKLIGGQDYLAVSGVMKETFQKVTGEDLSPLLPQITHPVYIAFGKHDSYVPYTDGEYMKQRIPNAQLTLFEDGKHGIHKTHAKQLRPLFTTFFQ